MPLKIQVFRFIYTKFVKIYEFSVKYQNNGKIIFEIRCFFYSAEFQFIQKLQEIFNIIIYMDFFLEQLEFQRNEQLKENCKYIYVIGNLGFFPTKDMKNPTRDITNTITRFRILRIC